MRFERTNLRIVYLKNYLRKMKCVCLNSQLDNKVQHQLFNTLSKPIVQLNELTMQIKQPTKNRAYFQVPKCSKIHWKFQ
jgi:hypothetical protein